VLLIEPVALGAGQRLFDRRTALTLAGAKTYECGITRLIYRPAREDHAAELRE
jgi:hypothetical protein